MILVDTSILIDYLRSPSSTTRAKLISEQAVLCGVTRAEILAGARNESEISKLSAALDGFGIVEIKDSDWNALGVNLHALRPAGVVVPFQDALIATIAVTRDIPVWTTDAHFQLMQKVLPLRLVEQTV